MNDRQASILLVDDQPENLLAMEAVLEPLGHELVRAASGEEALRRLLHDDFALILLDARMPDMDGFETAALIKRRERTRNIPIIFVTAVSTDASQVFRGYSHGAVDYIFKPVNPSILRSKVGVFVELYRKERDLHTSEQLFRGAFDDAPVGVAMISAEDGDARLLRVNRALCTLSGFEAGQLLEGTLDDLIQGPQRAHIRLSLGRVRGGDLGALQVETQLAHARGASRSVLFSASLVRDMDGDPVCALAHVQDLTEYKRAEAELTRARAELELRTAARRQALELNDNVLQGLAIAKYALASGNVAQVAQAIEQTLANVRQIVDDLIGSGGLQAGDLRRDRPALSGDGPPARRRARRGGVRGRPTPGG